MAFTPSRPERLPIRSERDIVSVRQAVRKHTGELGFGLVDQTKMVTAASELARNTFIHGGGGFVVVEEVRDGLRRGLRLCFEDSGPGIPDVHLALTDGFTTAGGMGLGLGGARRLSHAFEISTRPGQGTRVVILRWK